MACCCELQNTLDVEVTQDALLDVEIGGSTGALLQAKSVDITENGTSVVSPDDGFDGLSGVEINTNVQISVKQYEKDVCFYDYDGTLLYSYDVAEVLADDFVMPEPPYSHDLLTFECWTMELDELKQEAAIMEVVNIVALYQPKDSKTYLFFNLVDDKTIVLSISSKETATIDWGDGTTTAAAAADVYHSHTYDTLGQKVVSIKKDNKSELYLHAMPLNETTYNTKTSFWKIYLSDDIMLSGTSEGKNTVLCQYYALGKASLNKAFAYYKINYRPKCKISYGNFTTMDKNDVLEVAVGTNGIFRGCGALRRLSHHSNTTSKLGNANSNNLTYGGSDQIIPKIVMPQGNTIIGRAYSMPNVQRIKYLGDVTFVGYGFGEYLVYLGLEGCTQVPVLYSSTIFETAMSANPNMLHIVVPKALYAEWITATNWVNFASVIYYVDDNGDYSQVIPE